jgi:hypothetical protein
LGCDFQGQLDLVTGEADRKGMCNGIGAGGCPAQAYEQTVSKAEHMLNKQKRTNAAIVVTNGYIVSF